MVTETVYRCDVTDERIPEEDAVPVTVYRVRSVSPRGEQAVETVFDEYNRKYIADHVSRDVIDEYGFGDEEITELEVILIDKDPVGWRNAKPRTTTTVRRPDDRERMLCCMIADVDP